jgi:secreted Zn-dependent insulinase-like peptidase
VISRGVPVLCISCSTPRSFCFQNASSHALFSVSLSLSEEGVANWHEIVSMIYRYVGMLRYHCQVGLPMWIYDELRSIQEISYRYDDESSPEDLVESLADELSPSHPLPADRLLDGSLLLFEYEPEMIQDLLDTYFKPENSRIDLSSTLLGRSADYEAIEPALGGEPMSPSDDLFDPTKGSTPPFQEPVFGTFYWYQTLSDEQILKWRKLSEPQLPSVESMLTLPPRNHFVPQDFVLKELPASDCDHPLLNCSIKLQTSVGKRKVRHLSKLFINSTNHMKHLTPNLPSNGSQLQSHDTTA